MPKIYYIHLKDTVKMKIHSDDKILRIAYPENREIPEKSIDQGFNEILGEVVEDHSEVNIQNQTVPQNVTSGIHPNECRSKERSSVGKILSIDGNASIFQDDMENGYSAKKDLPLYKESTIITQEKTRIRVRLNDGGIISLTPKSKLILDETVYGSGKTIRSLPLGMKLRKARMWIKRMFSLNHSKSREKTPTSICGVRG